MEKFILLARVLQEMLNWKALLDVSLMAALIYLIYRTLRRLGTWRILLGIITAVAVFLLANLLQLEGISWIYSNLSQVAVLGIIVIFQPEIRKVFERAVSFKRNETEHSGSALSRIVGNAVFTLAEQSRGGILVFPGKEPVAQWLSGGFPLDAEPSFPLILSIFDPNSPGHDGALVVTNGRLTRFGVRLPISKTSILPSEFGTRHQAAMGLSEVTDALVAVVSEEKGTVTAFSKGQRLPIDTPHDLTLKIEAHWEKTSSYLPRISPSQPWKIPHEVAFSIILALIFWASLAASNARIFESSLVVPIEYAAIPQNLALVGNKPTEIRLHLAGPKTDLDALNSSRLSVKVDLSKAMAGRQTLPVNEESISLPKRVKILEVSPSSLSIALEEVSLKELKVKPQLVGRIPEGYELVSISIVPARVKTLSPAGIGKRGETSLATTPIYLEGIKEDVTIFCKIIVPPDIQPADKRWPDVQVYIRVIPKTMNNFSS